MPFTPAGEKARWKIIYERFQKSTYGQIIGYAELGSLIDVNSSEDKGRHTIQMAARRATIQLERVEGRTTVSVRNTGYQIARPGEHLDIGRSRNRRAGRQLQRGENVTTGVDLNLVDDETRKALTMLARGFAVQRDINRRVLDAQQRQGKAIQMLFERVEKLEQRELEA